MGYQAKHIQDFINKVKAEAEEEAQKVFDANKEKLQEMVANQVRDGQKLYIGMGTATIADPNRDLPYNYAEKFLAVVADTQYHKDQLTAGFNIDNVDKRK